MRLEEDGEYTDRYDLNKRFILFLRLFVYFFSFLLRLLIG